MSMIQPELVAAIVRDAGGEVVGRTRLQKIAYLLDVVGFGNGFRFSYRHYGPFSEDVADSAMLGALLGDLAEQERRAAWGGTYSIYSVAAKPEENVPLARTELAQMAAKADSIALELAATAVFLAKEGFDDPWGETARRKPEKVSGGRLQQAQELLAKLRTIDVPTALPEFA